MYRQTPPPGPRPVRNSRAGGEKFVATKDKEGKSYKISYIASYDGKDHAVSGTPYADAIALGLVDRRTIEATWKKDEKAVRVERRVVSETGKTMTTTARRTTEGLPGDIMV